MSHNTRARQLSLFAAMVLGLCLQFSLAWLNPAQAEPNCSGAALISETFANGARWDMCWESRIRENLVLQDVYYTPPQGTSTRVLSSAQLSQLHVAYDDSDVTYNDITQYGLGGGYLVALTEADCPYGELLQVQTRPAVCRWRSQGDDSYRTASRSVSTESLTLFSVSQVGAYAYIVTWKFFADGAIEPQIGATGALQRSSDNTELPFGRILQGDNDTLWLSHTHNYYWRLDFDLGDDANNDVVSEIRTDLQPSGKRISTRETFTTEQARRIDPAAAVAWEIRDKSSDNSVAGTQQPGYRFEPIRFGHRLVRDQIEPYTDFDFFVTRASDCERFASQNARYNPECENNVLQFANDESVVDQDVVLWHRVSFHHVPRSEDQRHMHTHWDGFAIEPVNVHVNTPGVLSIGNTPPQLQAFGNQKADIGKLVHMNIDATDADGDLVFFSATGLPPGLNIDESGHIHGEPTASGSYPVTITVTDQLATSDVTINWQVGRKKRLGAISWPLFFCVLLLSAFRRGSLTGKR